MTLLLLLTVANVFTQVSPQTSSPIEKATTETAIINLDTFYKGCTVEKLCFGLPDGCVAKKDCPVVTAIKMNDGGGYEFEMRALNNASWIGVGLSRDVWMGDDLVHECVKEGDEVKIYLSWNIPRPELGSVRLSNQQGIKLMNSSLIDGDLYCRVLRDSKIVVADKGEEFDLVSTKYYLLIAAGFRLKENSVGFHKLGALSSSHSRYLSDVTSIEGVSQLLLKFHGVLMLIAWVGTASLGTLVVKCHRNTWIDRKIFGKDLWFACHRFFMLLTWALTLIAFVLIFLELKAWSVEGKLHAVLGCIVTILCFLQPIGAFFRPQLGTEHRPIFNRLHWFGGNLTNILAFVTIFFAANLRKARLPGYFKWIFVAFVVFHEFMRFILLIFNWNEDNSLSSPVAPSGGNRLNFGPPRKFVEQASAHSFFTKQMCPGIGNLLLCIYTSVVCSLTVCLTVIVAIT